MNVAHVQWRTVAVSAAVLFLAAYTPAALAQMEAAGDGDPDSNMDYIDSDPDQGVGGNPSIMIEVDGYHAGFSDCWICDEYGDYACSPYGIYPGWGWPAQVGFFDPVPAGHLVTRIEAVVNGTFCIDSGGGGTGFTTVYVNGMTIGTGVQLGSCFCGTCDPLTMIGSDFPCGVPGYVYGARNWLSLVIDGVSCISDVHLYLVYEPIPAPFCDADGPYTVECQGALTDVALDGSASYDPCDVPFTYDWTTDCPGGIFDDNTLAMPTLTVDSVVPCPLVCSVDLDLDNGDATSSCSSTVTVDDTIAPDINCPGDLIVECDESTDPANTGTATATDTCDASLDITYADVETPGQCPQEKTITRMWTATDD
ncbi:MAG: hypothetical protein ACYTFA_14765, partial [Planctomycetota bacterium]